MNKQVENIVIENIKDYFSKSAMMTKYNGAIISKMNRTEIVKFMSEFLKDSWEEWINWLIKVKDNNIELIIKESRRCADYVDERIWQTKYESPSFAGFLS